MRWMVWGGEIGKKGVLSLINETCRFTVPSAVALIYHWRSGTLSWIFPKLDFLKILFISPEGSAKLRRAVRGSHFAQEKVGGPKSYEHRNSIIEVSMMGGGGEEITFYSLGGPVEGKLFYRPIWRINEPKKTGERSARARTRGQNPLVIKNSKIYFL